MYIETVMQVRGVRKTAWWELLPAALLLVLVVLLFCRRALHALWILQFGDETGHLLAARVLQAGGLLYRDYVDSHGPLPYVLAQAAEMIPGVHEPGAARLAMMLAMFVTTAMIAASPCLRGCWERFCAAALFLGLSTSLWVVQALFMLDYQPIAGMLLAIGCAQFCCGIWCGLMPGRTGMAVAGAAFMLAPFAAYAYAPSALLLTASGLIGLSNNGGPRSLLPFAAGAATALAAIGGWMLLYCDLPGYVAYHFILNQFYFAPYIHFRLADIVTAFVPHRAGGLLAQSMATLVCLVGLYAFCMQRNVNIGAARRACMLLCGLVGMALANPKGSPGFQNGAFVLIAFAVSSLGLARLPRAMAIRPDARTGGVAVMLFAACIFSAERIARAALSSPHGDSRGVLKRERHIALVPSDAEMMRRLRQAAPVGDPILVLPFQPQIYFLAGRLPMTGFDHYFPWDADYARHPWFARGRDICAALPQVLPPVIVDTNWVVWNKYALQDYMPCLSVILSRFYQRQNGSYFYVRNDRVVAWNR